jgi:putative endonuclease
MNYFYILQSDKDGRYYYGSTNDLSRRFEQHANGKVASTAYRRPLNLVYYEAYTLLDMARKRERQVKSSGSIRQAILGRIANKPS